MRRHLASSSAALVAAIASFGLTAAPAFATGPATATTTPAMTTASTAATAATTATTPTTTTTTTTTPTTTPTTPTTTTTTPTTTRPTPTKPPPIHAVKAKATLYLPDLFVVDHQTVTVPGRSVHVDGVVRPYVPGQWVRLQASVAGRSIKSERLRIKPSRNASYGRFSETLSSPRAGIVVVSVTHKRTPKMLGFLAQRGIAALDEQVGFDSTGKFVQLIQQRLAALHFYIPQTGVYDQGTGLALDAYHRLLGWGVAQTLNGATIDALLDGRGSFQVRYPGDGTHAEGNLSDQLLALINGSHVYAIYPISSGKPSTPTVLGRFHVYSRVPGYLPDGMYYSDFFYSGYAIHGYDPAPDYPASHGCMRLPIVDAISVFNWLNYGDAVDVYY